MNHTQHNQIVSFIWNIADDLLRDVYQRGKYRDIILPFTVLRRLDALLEPSKKKVLEMNTKLNEMKIDNQAPQLRRASGFVFYNTSPYTLKTLLNEPSNIRINLESYLDGFSSNVQDIISKFKLRNQLDTLEESNITFPTIEKFCSSQINLSPDPVKDTRGKVIHEGLSNLGMGYVFEELIRRFNEENNEEAGEHFTPREIIQLMTHLIFEPIQDQIKEGTYLIYDPACGSGGMLTESEHFAKKINPKAKFLLYGQESQPETYAICKADMLIKEEDPEKIAFGSTLSDDGFPNLEFDFMLTNPPYGKSWSKDMDAIVEKVGSKKEITDPRFMVGIPRSSDGQLLFMCNMLHKMKKKSPLGSRIASVHNGSSLFTGDAGGGESEIRRWIFENDWLEAIVALPENIFYNTGIPTYIWVLTNRKSEHRKGKVQLINASGLHKKLRKNLGKKNCELTKKHIDEIARLSFDFKETSISKIFDNEDFGYSKIIVERPLRLAFELSGEKAGAISDELGIRTVLEKLRVSFGSKENNDFNPLPKAFEKALKASNKKLGAKEKKAFLGAISWKSEDAEPVFKKKEKDGTIIYEADSDLRDNENVPLKEDIEEYFVREVLPYVPDAWIDHEKTQVGYEISFTKYFYEHEPLRSLEEIVADIMALEEETDGLLKEIVS